MALSGTLGNPSVSPCVRNLCRGWFRGAAGTTALGDSRGHQLHFRIWIPRQPFSNWSSWSKVTIGLDTGSRQTANASCSSHLVPITRNRSTVCCCNIELRDAEDQRRCSMRLTSECYSPDDPFLGLCAKALEPFLGRLDINVLSPCSLPFASRL